MALLNRLSRLVHADVHAVLDNLEEPHILLKQSIREMEISIQQAQQKVDRLDTKIENSKLELSQVTGRLMSYQTELDTCFEADNEILAKAILRKKLESERMQEVLKNQLEQALLDQTRQSQWLEESTEQLESLRKKASLLTKDINSAKQANSVFGDQAHAPGYRWTVSKDEVEIAFLQEKAKRQSAGE